MLEKQLTISLSAIHIVISLVISLSIFFIIKVKSGNIPISACNNYQTCEHSAAVK